ncbi:MBL fold metallo-hydrolase [Alkalimonas sp. MEB108]|uniref:MBL fold metallo-hydrolase n=1 Tax=Alkalimonas cellulosilytica TaxID=3058395 RepID=A0ABU7J4H3_9GAMM|nr:MBL fold metallo-hydrolase [Alkalimonas sp. MEB108]MEE2001411.1 MBL fold metallo-hydrolase [Alkalimonas sp. MEB108]
MAAHTVEFHPVGQGLFSTGTVSSYGNGETFHYVYDCGTSSSKKFLSNAISSYKKSVKTLDLVVISHFDKDHISGLIELLEHHPTRILMLPAISLSQKLVIAFSEGISIGSRYMHFILDPVAYLTSHPKIKVHNIIFVPADHDEKTEIIESSANDLSETRTNWPEMLLADLNKASTIARDNLTIHTLKQGGRLILNQVFEFVPYNDALLSTVSRSFKTQVEKEKEILLNQSSTTTDKKSALSKLKSYYDKRFGSDSIARNMISLFLYTGPINETVLCSDLEFYRYRLNDAGLASCLKSKYIKTQQPSVLFTGDGYLNTHKRLNNLAQYIGTTRLNDIGCLQVMHHGSKHSWHDGLAKKLSPVLSVFSSDPSNRRLQHPHLEVIRDFLPYIPTQVDKDHRVIFRSETVFLPNLIDSDGAPTDRTIFY